MTQKEIEEAVKTIKTMKPCEQRFKAEQVLLDFAQSYLDLKEWPEENEIKEHFSRRIGEFISCKYCVPEDSKRRFLLEEFDEHIHEALHLCKLIYLKRENEIKEFLIKVSDKDKEMSEICEKEKFVFDDPWDIKNKWQRLAFVFYSEIAQLSNDARAIHLELTEGER